MKRSLALGLLTILMASLLVLGPATSAFASASGCNGNVCIYVNGSGLHVNFIEDKGTNPNSYKVTTFAYITSNGQTIWAGPVQSLCAKCTFTWHVTFNSNFANNSKVCAGWHAISGYPCETVHS